jgi:hypothetical protein
MPQSTDGGLMTPKEVETSKESKWYPPTSIAAFMTGETG